MKKTLAQFLKTRKISHDEKYPRTPVDEILEYHQFTKVPPYIPKSATLLIVKWIKRSEGTVKTHLHKAHHSLRNMLRPYLQNEDSDGY